MELNRFTQEAVVMNVDTDFRRMIKPSALFRYVEQIGADHARAFGMDDDFFKERNTAFLVGKQGIRIARMPMRAEKLILFTVCEECKRGSMKRLTWICDTEGNELAMADTRWIVVDTVENRILRRPGWEMPGFWNEDVLGELPLLVHKTKELCPAGTRKALYSMCDLNGHINNSFYLDIACDALPLEVIEAAPLRFTSIKYHREVPMGSEIELFYAPSMVGWYVMGRREGHTAFECYLEFGADAQEKTI